MTTQANPFPRRICLDRLTPAEAAIVAAMRAVEEAGCDVRLTDAITFLGKAREAVADFVDGVPRREPHVCGANGFGLAHGDVCPACTPPADV